MRHSRMQRIVRHRAPRPKPGLRLKHLLLVSGPSGAGKTTFLAQLLARQLPTELSVRLPAGAENWRVTNGKADGYAYRLWKGAWNSTEAMLHYDIMRTFATSIARYEDDPSLAALQSAEKITVLFLATPAEVLVDQLSRKRSRSTGISLWAKSIERNIRRKLRPQRQPVYSGKVGPGQRIAHLTQCYQESGFLEARSREWILFLERSVGHKFASPVIYAEPVPGEDLRFRLAKCVSGSVPY